MENSDIDFTNIISLPSNIVEPEPNSDELTPGDFASLLNELNKQVNNADGSISELMRRRDEIEQSKKELEEKTRTFDADRANFDRLMKDEYQKLNDQKIDFEQEKTKIFNEIQDAREELSRKNREFEKYREDQMNLIRDSKKELAKNCEQFEKIVASFNRKIDKFE